MNQSAGGSGEGVHSRRLDCTRILPGRFAESKFPGRIELGPELVSIGKRGFFAAEMSEVWIAGDQLERMGELAFASCPRLRRVEVHFALPELRIHPSAFLNSSETLRVFLPNGAFGKIWNNPRQSMLYRHVCTIAGFKDRDESCGSACARYIAGNQAKTPVTGMAGAKSFWIFDVALLLGESLGMGRLRLCCGDSTLMRDFRLGRLDREFEGRRALERYLDRGGKIECGKQVRDCFRETPRNSRCLILLKSPVGQEGPSCGSHYVVVEETRDHHALVINPMATVLVKMPIPFETLVSQCARAGGWILSIQGQEELAGAEA